MKMVWSIKPPDGHRRPAAQVPDRDAAADTMVHTMSNEHRQIIAELETLPEEYHSLLLQIIRAYRESVTLKSAADSFEQGWREAQAGEVRPLSALVREVNGRR
jgi:hypothetical protein